MNPLIVPLTPTMLLLDLSRGWFIAMAHIEQPGMNGSPANWLWLMPFAGWG
jgi:hypothetical protein